MHFKLVIVQSSERELQQTVELFEAFGCEVVAVGRTGSDALRLGKMFKPNALIMDAFLPEYNCEEITEQLEQTVVEPMVKIALSEERNDRMAENFLNNGGDLFLRLPLDYAHTVRRMEKYIAMRKRQIAMNGASTVVRNCTRKIQMRMKMPVSINGFVYLQDAIELVMAQPEATRNVMAMLYPAIGVKHHVPSTCVERCIRTAIEKTFERGDMDFLYPHFGHAIRPNTGRPANGEFIAILAEMVREDLKYVI